MSASASTYLCFATVSPGLESLLCSELGELSLDPKPCRGGVEWRGAVECLWLVHHRSRLAESVRVRLRPFRAADFASLERALMRLPWHAYLNPGLPVRFSASCHKSKLFHTGAVEERARNAVRARLGACIEPREPGLEPREPSLEPAVPVEPGVAVQEIHLRLERDEVQASVEATGKLLHRRGYRTHVGKAPLRETLAAACARLLDDAAPERAHAPVWDPCCGSGTLLTEWLLRAAAGSVCGARNFSFELWPIHDPARYAAWRGQFQALASNAPTRHALGSDRDARVLIAAKHNAERAGVGTGCDWLEADFSRAVRVVPQGYRVLSNLPYGKRLADAKLAQNAFASLDELLATRPDLRPALLLNGGPLPARVRCKWEPLAHFSNGGLSVTAWLNRA